MLGLIAVLELVGLGFAILCLLYTLTAVASWYCAYFSVREWPNAKAAVPILGNLPELASVRGPDHMRINGEKYNNYLFMFGSSAWLMCRDVELVGKAGCTGPEGNLLIA